MKSMKKWGGLSDKGGVWSEDVLLVRIWLCLLRTVY